MILRTCHAKTAEASRTITLGAATLHEGDLLTLDGNAGVIYQGAAQTEIEYPVELLARLESLRHGAANAQA